MINWSKPLIHDAFGTPVKLLSDCFLNTSDKTSRYRFGVECSQLDGKKFALLVDENGIAEFAKDACIRNVPPQPVTLEGWAAIYHDKSAMFSIDHERAKNFGCEVSRAKLIYTPE